MSTFLLVSIIVLGIIGALLLFIVIIAAIGLAFGIDINSDEVPEKELDIFVPGSPLLTTLVCGENE